MLAPTCDDPSFCAQTRERLLEAAGEVFAEKGFRAATTREICRRARANVAAINYHFGDKERLYVEVLGYAHGQAGGPAPRSRDAGVPADERLRAFVRWFLRRILGEGRPAWQGRLLAREMIDPTRALDTLVQTEFRPIVDELEALCREILGPQVPLETVRVAARSVIAQCVFYRHAQSVLARIHPAEAFGAERAEGLADPITEFSLGGLRRLAEARAVAGEPVHPR